MEARIVFTDSWKTYAWFLLLVVGIALKIALGIPALLQITLLAGMFYFFVMAMAANMEYLFFQYSRISNKTIIVYVLSSIVTLLVFLFGFDKVRF